MALFKNKETGRVLHAYEYMGTAENMRFIKSMLRDEHGFDNAVAMDIVLTAKKKNHIVILGAGEYTIVPDSKFNTEYESHMIQPDEEGKF